MMDLITKNDKSVKDFLAVLDELLGAIEDVVDNCKPSLNGEQYLTDYELSKRLNISRRALQDYRNQGKIPFIHMGGKILYRESDIVKMLEENYYKAWH
uniref:helix-turn-helix domain-containing protein n=1 Tax=uncultured Dysgonomonas sp. TaxID=206096 RepID=UPI002608011A|nr:helix-turn-helix domain-containing protein [uncultured Dysgonomonas sp.]